MQYFSFLHSSFSSHLNIFQSIILTFLVPRHFEALSFFHVFDQKWGSIKCSYFFQRNKFILFINFSVSELKNEKLNGINKMPRKSFSVNNYISENFSLFFFSFFSTNYFIIYHAWAFLEKNWNFFSFLHIIISIIPIDKKYSERIPQNGKTVKEIYEII